MKRYLLLLVITIIAIRLSGQQYNFTNYSLEDGLPQSQIYVGMEDSRGYLWLGTNSGLSRFDGRSFHNFTTNEGLCHNQIRAIYEDRLGKIWIGTRGGYLCSYNGKSFETYNEKNNLDASGVLCISENDEGELMIGTVDKGLYIKRGTVFEPIELPIDTHAVSIKTLCRDHLGAIWAGTAHNGVVYIRGGEKSLITDKEGLPGMQVNSIIQDGQKNIWIATNNGVAMIGPDTSMILDKSKGLPDNHVNALLMDSKGNLWLSVQNMGVAKYSEGQLYVYNQNNGLCHNIVLHMLEDRSGNIWFFTDGGGICKFEGQRFEHLRKADGLPDDVIINILEDKRGNLWFSTYGKGVCKYDGQHFRYYTKEDGLVSDLILYMYQDSRGRIWFCSRNNGVNVYANGGFTKYEPGDDFPAKNVYCIDEDSTGNLLMATLGDGLLIYDNEKFHQLNKEDGLASNILYAVMEDSKGNIWIGYDNEGIEKLSAEISSDWMIENRLYPREYVTNLSREQKLPGKQIISILEDKNGNIWFNSFGHGISRWDGRAIRNYSTKDGLNSNNIYFLINDRRGNLWAGSEIGLNRLSSRDISQQEWEIKTYGRSEGYTGIESNMNAAAEDEEGRLYFGTIKGVTIYNPEFDQNNISRPNIFITGIDLFFEPVDWSTHTEELSGWFRLPRSIELDHNQNNLTFHYAGIELSSPDKVEYQYMLEGFDEDWLPLTQNQEASYTYIPPGEYTFRVKARNSDGVWSERPATFSFTIKPPFWVTWEFYLIVIVSGLGLIFLGVKWRLRQLGKEKRELESKVMMRTIELEKEKRKVEEQADILARSNKELEKLSIVASETENSIAIIDSKGNLDWVNQGFRRLYEMGRSEFISKYGKNFLTTSRGKETRKAMKQVFEDHKPNIYVTNYTPDSGKTKWIQTTLTPLAKDGKIERVIVVESDITIIKEAEQELEIAKQKTDQLLLNILPNETADELKTKGFATPRKYRMVSVMFSDFKNFTRLSEGLSPEKLVDKLHSYFVAFDEIIEEHHIEKIKTIGDAYMCVGGIPIRNKTNPIDVVLAALQIQAFAKKQVELVDNPDDAWALRLGIHTGMAIAGVVGKKKFVYDIWGDTVNIASRLETACEVGRVNISGATHKHIAPFFDCEYRGKIEAKNKGKIDMYYVNRLLPGFSADDKGSLPNEKFEKLYSQL